jgi:hypothetical protein
MTEPPANGSTDEPGATPGIEAPLPPPESIATLAASCIDYVRHAVGVEPDLSPETLPIVDHYVAEARASIAERVEILPLLARTVGAYFGEVVRRRIPAFWMQDGPEDDDWALCGSSVFLSLKPIGVAWDALCQSGDHVGPASELRCRNEDRDAVHARLASLPPVPPDEYYLLSTRLEVLEIAAEEIRARQLARGGEADAYDEQDYRA